VTDAQHLWACALEVEQQHGVQAVLHVAERIGALALEGKGVGVERWKAIAGKLDALRPETASVDYVAIN
jgi:hypothetical protein